MLLCTFVCVGVLLWDGFDFVPRVEEQRHRLIDLPARVQVQDRVARRRLGVLVVDPLVAGRPLDRRGHEPAARIVIADFRAVEVLGHDRQAVVAVLDVVLEAEVRIGPGLADPPLRCHRPVQRRLDPLVQGLVGVEGRGRDRRIDRVLQHLALEFGAVQGDVVGERPAMAARAHLARPGLLRLHRREARIGRRHRTEVRGFDRAGQVGEHLVPDVVLPEQADAGRDPVIALVGLQVEGRGDAGNGEAGVVTLDLTPVGAGHQRDLVGDEQPALAEHVERLGVLQRARGRRAAATAVVDVEVGVHIAGAVPGAEEGVGALAADLAVPVEAAEGAVVAALLVDDLEDRVIQVLPHRIDRAFEDQAVVETPGGAQRTAHAALVAAVVIGQVAGGRLARIGVELRQGQRARDLLVDVRAVDDQAKLAVLAERTPDVQRAELDVLLALRAPALAGLVGAGHKDVPVTDLASQGDMFAGQTIGAAVDADLVLEAGVLARGRHHVDRAAQEGAAEAQGVAAAIDLGVASVQRVGDLGVAIAVGLVQRHAVLGDQEAPVVVGVADARAADRDADVAAPLALGVDAGGVAQHVVQRQGLAVDVAFLRDHRDRAGGFRQALAGVGDDRRVFGVRAGGDDDRRDLRGVSGGVGCGSGGCEGERGRGGQQKRLHGNTASFGRRTAAVNDPGRAGKGARSRSVARTEGQIRTTGGPVGGGGGAARPRPGASVRVGVRIGAA